jgi:hypothetical protein
MSNTRGRLGAVPQRGEPLSIVPMLKLFVDSAEQYGHATLEPYRELLKIGESLEAEVGPLGNVDAMLTAARNDDEFLQIAALLGAVQADERGQEPPVP